MEFSVPIFLFVLLLGIVQLAVGVIFGRCLPVHGERRRRERNGLDASHFSQIARRVYQVIANISRDVDEHRSQVARMNDDLAAASCEDPARLAEFVVESVSHLMDLNANLQSRLSAAEDKLREQTRQIESHVAEARTDPLTRLPNRRAFDDDIWRATMCCAASAPCSAARCLRKPWWRGWAAKSSPSCWVIGRFPRSGS